MVFQEECLIVAPYIPDMVVLQSFSRSRVLDFSPFITETSQQKHGIVA